MGKGDALNHIKLGKVMHQRGVCYGLVLISLILMSVPLSVIVYLVSAAPTTVLTPKWTRTGLGSNYEGGLVIGDVTGDGREDVVFAGGGSDTIYVLNGLTGSTIATYVNSRIGQYCQPQLYDVDGDGVLDILVPLYYRPGLAVVKYDGDSSLTALWVRDTEGTTGSGSVMAKPVAGDINHDGHPEIFLGSQDVSPGDNSTGRYVPNGYDGTITKFDYQGNLLASTFTWRPCSGGLSLADTDNDGVFELYQGDRQEGYTDGGYGKGVRSLWADNLTERWNRIDFLSSSQAPVLVDVNGDGVKEVLAGMYREMNILNSTNGKMIRKWTSNAMSVHYGFTVYDIDGDGHLELLCSDGDHDNDPYADVFDLVTGQLDAELSLAGGDWKWGPLVADIDPTHPGMEIIVCPNGTTLGTQYYHGAIMIYSSSYESLQNVTYRPGSTEGQYSTSRLGSQLGYPIVQDIDGDGLLEMVTDASSGAVYAFNTQAPAPGYSSSLPGSQRIRSEVTYFGECRLGVAEHTIMPWAQDYWTTPLVAPVSPGDNTLKIPRSTTQLSFKLRDHQSLPLTYTVTTSPDVGSGSGASIGNSYNWGTYTLTFNKALDYDTTYKWTVTASDGTHVTRRTYTFRTQLAPNSGNSVPTQTDPLLTSQDGLGMTSSTFVGTAQNTQDANGDKVTNIYKWSVGSQPVANLILPFDTRNETVAKDYSAYGNNGKVVGAVWTPNGIVGGAYSFDGKDDAIIVSDGGAGYFDDKSYPTNNPELGGDGTWNEITVEAWIYLTAYNNGSRIVAKIPSYELGFASGYTNRLTASVWPVMGKVAPISVDNGNQASTDRMQSVTATVNIQLNTWYHIAFTYKNGVGLKLYFNGALVASNTNMNKGPIKNSLGEPLYIGRLVQPFAGMIDDVRIYRYAQPTQQILNRYQESKDGLSTSSLFCPLGIAAAGDTLTCQVIPTDSFGEGTPKSASVTLLNTPPVASNVVVCPSRDRAFRLDDENLIAGYVYSDVDGNPETGSQIRWYMNGVLQAAFNDLKQVPAASTSVGQTWYFTVTPRDSGGAFGVLQTSGTITIRSNSVPVTGVPTLDSMNGGTDYDDEDLVATAAPTTDGDGDATTNIFHWTKGGVSQTNLQMPFDTEIPTIPGTNGVAKDYSGYGNNGVVNGSTWVQGGVVGGALSFDGNDYVTVQENGNTLGGDGSWSTISVEFWIRATGATTSTQTVVFKPNSLYAPGVSSYNLGYRVQYRYYADSYAVYWRISNSTGQSSSSFSTRVYEGPSQWHHVVCTYQSGVGLKIYTDGKLRSSIAYAGNINATSGGRLYIGGINSGQGDFVGQMDEVRIYPKVLSAAQVFQRYIETKDGLTATNTIVAQETSAGDNWVCQVIPSDSWQDGTAQNSATLHVDAVSGNSRPRIDWYSPADLTPDVNATQSLAFQQVSSDPDGGVLSYSWTLDSIQQATSQNWTYSPDAGSQGIHIVRVTVRDSGSLTDYQEWVVNVLSSQPPEYRNLIVLAAVNGNTNPVPGTYQYVKNSNASVLAIANVGYKLSYWLRNGSYFGSTNPVLVNMTANWELQPVFAEAQYTLTVNIVGSGSVTKNPDQATYAYNTLVTLTAVPADGWDFAGWSGAVSGTTNPTTVTMASNKTVTATFLPKYNLLIETRGSGSTDPAPGTYAYMQGASVQVDALPAVGYKLSYWLLNGTNVGAADPYTVIISENRNLTAVFVAAPTSIFEDGFESSSTSAWDSSTVTSGETAAVTADYAHHGTYSLKSTSNGGGGTESARVNKALSPTLSEIYVRGYFKLTQNGIVDNGDKVKLIELRAGSTIIAAAGLWQYSGTLRWWIETRSGTTYVETYTTQVGSLDLTQWFSLELYWKLGATNGGGKLWVNGNQIYQITNADTDNYGNCSALRFGLAEVTNCGSMTLYSDCAVVASAYIGPDGPPVQYTLHVEVRGSGSTNATGDKLYNAGAIVAVQATADLGNILSYWLLNGINFGNANPYTLTMNANYNLTAIFIEVSQYTLHVEVSGSGITNATGDNSYNAGTNVAVLATANLGYKLSYWLLDNNNVGSANPYVLVMNANYNLTAVFVVSTPNVIFEDGFESGSTSAWNSTTSATSGETVTVTTDQAFEGIYSLRSTSNGGGGTESARVNEVFSQTLSQIRVQGYFKLTQNGIIDNGDKIKLIELRAGSTIIAAAGLWQSGGTLRWWIEIRNGASYVETYTVQVGSLDLTQWFSVELYWKLGSTDGSGTLKVNGNLIYEINNLDTDNYGNCSALRFGLTELTNCGSTTLYSDLIIVSDI